MKPNPLDLDAIRQAKAEAEAEIMAVLCRLKEETGLCAMECSLEVFRWQLVGEHHPRHELQSVTLALESI